MTAGNHILVVEDEAVIRSSLRRLLERHEYKVSEAGSVQEALDNFDINSFDVVLSDLRLPGAPGTDLIKATNRPVLIMTSYSSIRSAIDSMKMGAVDYIAKPFEHSELLESVSKVLRDHAGGIELATPDEFEPPVHGMIGSCPPDDGAVPPHSKSRAHQLDGVDQWRIGNRVKSWSREQSTS